LNDSRHVLHDRQNVVNVVGEALCAGRRVRVIAVVKWRRLACVDVMMMIRMLVVMDDWRLAADDAGAGV